MTKLKLSILAVGRFDDYRKDIKKLIKVVSIFCKKNIQYKVVLNIVSPKNIPSSKNIVNVKNLQLIVHTNLNDRILQNLYKKNDIYLSSSIEEGFGFVIIDAIKHNCLVISTRTAGSIDILGSDYPLMANNYRWYSLLKKIYYAIELLPEKNNINQRILNFLYQKKMLINLGDSYSIIKELI